MTALVAFAAVGVASAATAKTVRVSEFGFDAGDSTRFLQAALDSGATTVVIDRQPSEWVTLPLFMTNSNVEVVLENGVVLRAKRGAYHGLGDSLVRMTGGATNVALRGEGKATLAMWKQDYQNPALGYAHSEWRHAVGLYNVQSATVRNLTILSSGGDGVYVNGAKSVTLENLSVYDHHRQGMSPISVDGMMVRRCAFNETRGTAPESGIDMEPNFWHNRFVDVVYEDCVFNGNAAHGIDIHIGALTKKTHPISITFRRCQVRGNGACGFSIYAAYPPYALDVGPVQGFVRFEGCRFEGNGSTAVKVMNHTTNGLDLAFSKCLFDARGSQAESAVLLSNSQLAADFGGIRFDDCEVVVDAGRKAFDFEGPRGVGVTDGVAGTVDVVVNGKRCPFDFAAFRKRFAPHPELVVRFKSAAVDFRSLVAPQGIVSGKLSPVIRDSFVFVQTVSAAGEYPIRFVASKLRKGGSSKVCAVVQLFDAAGTDLGMFEIPEGEFTYPLKAKGPGVFRLQVSPRNTGLVQLASPTPGGALLCDSSFGFFHGSNVKLYFRVPKGAKEVLVDVRPEERVSVRLVDASGSVADEMPFQAAGRVLKAAFAPRAEDEVWSLQFPSIEEDFRFQLGGDAVPLCSLEREGVILSK